MRLALVFALLGAAACTVGDPNALPTDEVDAGRADGGGGRDGGGGGDGGGNNNACENLQTAGNGEHNPGTSCIGAGCHDGNTAGAPRFYLAGTLYTAANSTTPIAGATIIVPTGGGNPIKMVTATNGNFWLTTPVTLPIRGPKASLCPDTVQMTADVNNPNCNSCHGAGNRIHLP